MPFSPIDPVDEQRALADVQYTLSQEEQTQRLVNPDIASRVSNIYRQAPYIPASVVIALAKGGASPDAVNKTAELAAKQLVQKKPKKQSWFERNVYGNLKETARWSAAALNLAPDLAQNVASQLFNPANPDGFDGWFKSTQLGTMLANSGEAGDGFFIGGEAALTQAERARQFRGTVDGTGSAWTIGRGAASLAFKPGSKAYNILSGFVDAAVTIAADPSGPLGTKLRNVEAVSEALPYALKTKDARRAINLIPGVAGNDLSVATKVADAVKANAGLSLTDDIAFDQTKFGQWATTNKRAVRLTNMIAEVGASDLSEEAKTFRILEMFRQGDTYGIDIDTATAFAKAQNDSQVRAVLGVASGRLANNPDDILLPPDIRDIADTSWFNENLSRIPGYRSLKNSKWLSQVPDNAIVVNGTGRDKAKAIRTYANYLRGMGVEDVENHPVMTQVIKAVRMDSPADAKEALDTAFTQTVEEVLTRAGWDGESARNAMKVLRNNLNESRAYNVSRLGEADDGGFIQALRDSGILPDKVFDGLTPENWDKLVVKGPGAINELLDQVQVLPDYRMLRAAAQNPFLNRARIAYTSKGDRRRASAFVEFVQQDLWKPLALATGGYIMRNMMDAQVRIAMSGQKGLFNHPFQFIMYAMGRRGVGDIEGATLAAGKKSIDEFLADPPDDMKAFVEALQFGVYRNLEDSRVSLRRLVRNGNFSIADRSLDADAHTTGYVDNLAQIHDDSVLRRIARLASFSPEERQRRVTQWLNSAEGANDRTRLRRYFENGIRVGSSDGTGTDKLIRFTPEQLDDPGFLADWVGKISESKVQSIVNGDEDLRIVAAHNRVPFYTLSEQGQAKIPADRVLLDEGDLDITDMVDGLPDEIGSIIRFDNKVIDLPQGSEGVIVGKRYLTDANGNNVLGFDGEPILQNVIAPVFPGPAFTNDYIGSDALRELIDMKGQMGKLAPKVKRAERGLPGQDPNKWGQLGEQWDKVTDKFFKGLYGTATQVLEKSPLFRQLYYRTVVENADLLARDQADMLRANIKAFADQAGMSPEKYVGDKDVWRRLEVVGGIEDISATQARPITGKGVSNIVERLRSSGFKSSGENTPSTIAVKHFTGGDYHWSAIQDELRTGNAKSYLKPQQYATITKDIEELDKLFAAVPATSESFITFRGLKKTTDSDIVQRIKALRPGDEFTESGFSSTSFNQDFATRLAKNDGVVLEIINPSGSKGFSPIGYRATEEGASLRQLISDSTENEWLLPRNSRFQVVSTDGNKVRVRLLADTDSGVGGTITQLDQFAKAAALYEMQNTLFSASQRNNLEDVLRVVIPFGSAWREVLGTYASAVIEDPTRLRKAQLIFQGAQKFDPDGDGQGFFYKDPTTGEYSFNFPLSGQIAELITGQEVPLQAPVKRLSIGLGIIPSIGPVAQLAADTIIPDTPSTDNIVGILMPYGRGRGFNIVPLWAQRMYDVYRADTENTATVYGNTYIETMRALSASGDYDLSDPDEQQKLYADAKAKARWLAGMRVLGQFIGPTSPSPEFKITTKNGDMYASALIKELYKLQDPNSIGADGQPGNYDTAVARFLEIFGNDAFVYLSSKSEAVKGGLEATDVFSDWERTHDGLMNKYPDVAGFLAPGGSDFAFSVWQRQLRTGARRRLSDKEIVEQAQYRIASAHYRALRAKLPANPTREQTNWLRQWRIQLNKEYPGFPAVAEFNPGEYPKQIIQLKQMVADPDTQDNEVADALRTYLDARDKAVARYVASGGAEAGLARADKAAPLREWLNKLGTGLAVQVPEFSRIWERLLSNEVQL